MSNIAIYLLGTLLVVGGMAYGAHLFGVPNQWIVVGAIVLLGAGVLSAVANTRKREEPPAQD